MNDLLRETLAERAAGAEPPPLDLDGIIAAGNHRAARRRTLGILGGAVATAAVGVGGASVLRPRNEQPQPARPGPFTQRRATFALGNEIHYGSEIISVAPHKVTAFVQTDAGFVFLNAENAIHAADRSGVRSLGKSGWELTADFRGNLVAWMEGFNDHYEWVVYDVAARREVVRTRTDNTIPVNASRAVDPRVVALDGNFAYFGAQDGLYRWEITTNRGEQLAEVRPEVVKTVTAGHFVYQQPLDRFLATSLAIARTIAATAPARFVGQQAFLSPGAKYLVTEPYDANPGVRPLWAGLLMYDATSGKHVGLPDTYLTMVFGQWLDDTTCTIAGARRTPTAAMDLLVVDAHTGAVNVAVPNFSRLTFTTTPPRTAPFALPNGNPVYDLG